MVFIVSTTGEGEPPDTIRKFWRIIKDKSLKSDLLSGLIFALLGNTNSLFHNYHMTIQISIEKSFFGWFICLFISRV